MYTYIPEIVEQSTLDTIAPTDFQELVQEKQYLSEIEQELYEEEKSARDWEEAFMNSSSYNL